MQTLRQTTTNLPGLARSDRHVGKELFLQKELLLFFHSNFRSIFLVSSISFAVVLRRANVAKLPTRLTYTASEYIPTYIMIRVFLEVNSCLWQPASNFLSIFREAAEVVVLSERMRTYVHINIYLYIYLSNRPKLSWCGGGVRMSACSLALFQIKLEKTLEFVTEEK